MTFTHSLTKTSWIRKDHFSAYSCISTYQWCLWLRAVTLFACLNSEMVSKETWELVAQGELKAVNCSWEKLSVAGLLSTQSLGWRLVCRNGSWKGVREVGLGKRKADLWCRNYRVCPAAGELRWSLRDLLDRGKEARSDFGPGGPLEGRFWRGLK